MKLIDYLAYLAVVYLPLPERIQLAILPFAGRCAYMPRKP